MWAKVLIMIAVIGTNIYIGLVLAEMCNDPHISPHMAKPGIGLSSAATALVIAGLFCISYPEEGQRLTRWSQFLINTGEYIFPGGAEYARFWPAVGSQMIVLGLFFTPWLKSLLQFGPLVWMGKVSFAIYLIHGPLMRTLLAHLVFGWSERAPLTEDTATGKMVPSAATPEYNNWVTALSIAIFYIVLYRAASLWVKYVDPACGRVAKRIEVWMFAEGESTEKPPQLSLPA